MGNEGNIRLFGLALVLIMGIITYRKGTHIQAALILFIGPFEYFSYYLGIVLTPAKLLGIMFLLLGLLNGEYLKRILKSPLKEYGPYLIYAFFITLIMAPFWPDQGVAISGFMYSVSGRWLTQFLNVAVGLSLAGIICIGIGYSRNRINYIKVIIYSCTFLSLYGIYVWFAQKNGLPFTTITRGGGSFGGRESYVIYTLIDDVRVVRAYSFSGEPKGLSIIAGLGLSLLFFTRAFKWGWQKSIVLDFLLGIVMFVAMYLAYSTAGYLILVMGFVAVSIVLTSIKQIGKTLFRIIIFGAVVVAGSLVLQEADNSVSISRALESRVTERLDEGGLFTYAEEGMVKAWKDNPILFFTGAGLGGSTFYIREYSNKYAGYVAAARGIIGWLADIGVIGLFLFLVVVRKQFSIIRRHIMRKGDEWQSLVGLVVFGTYGLVILFTFAHWYLLWAIMGVWSGGVLIVQRHSAIKTHSVLNQKVLQRHGIINQRFLKYRK